MHTKTISILHVCTFTFNYALTALTRGREEHSFFNA